MKKSIAALGLAAALAFAAPSVSHAQPVVTGGLVNVTLTNIANGNNIPIASYDNISLGVALNLAANVCGVGVNVLATQLGTPGPISCQTATQMVTISPTQRQR